jgi:hypothetical protein
LASTISRDDIITVIGASSSPAAAAGAAVFFALWSIANLCQQSATVPRSTSDIVDIVIYLRFTGQRK